MLVTVSQIDTWRASSSEHQTLEFKEAKAKFDTNKLFQYCVALSNEGGGHLLLGIEDRPPRNVVGSAAFPNTVKIEEKIFNKLGFRVIVSEVTHPGGRVVIFNIPSRPQGTAFNVDGVYYMRAGSQLVKMSEDRLRSIFAEGQPDWLLQAAMDDCDEEAVVKLLDTPAYFDLMGMPYPANRTAVLDRFKREKLIQAINGRWTITRLGAVLFAKNLEDFDTLKRKSPRVIVYSGKGKHQTTKSDTVYSKGYAVGFQGLVSFIIGLVPSNEVIEKAIRREVTMFPQLAIRELVANSLIHQDFRFTGGSVMIELYDDRLEISNPGLPSISTDRFIDEYQSRNEVLADIMRRVGICEEKGSGIDKVVNLAEAYQLPAPDFRVSERRTTAVLFAHQDFDRMDKNARIRTCYQHCALKYVMNDRMNNSTLRQRFNLPENKTATVSQIISATVESNKIKLADPSQASTRYRSYVPFWA